MPDNTTKFEIDTKADLIEGVARLLEQACKKGDFPDHLKAAALRAIIVAAQEIQDIAAERL